jgi:hypothetical protein
MFRFFGTPHYYTEVEALHLFHLILDTDLASEIHQV